MCRPVRNNRHFIVKATVAGIGTMMAVGYLATRFTFAFDVQPEPCLGNVHYFLIDRGDRAVRQRGEVFAIRARGLEPIRRDGTLLGKVIQGRPGDRVAVTLQDTTVNGVEVGQGLDDASLLGIAPKRFVRQLVLGPHEYWAMGTTRNSFDSRYWGAVTAGQIVGRAYPLF